MDLAFPLRSGFLALPFEDDAMKAFAECQERLAFLGEIASFQKPTTPHLTLSYWPEMMEIEYGQVQEQAATIAERLRPFTYAIDGVDTFGKPGRDEVLYLKPAFSPELATAKKQCPWPNLYNPWQPHVTLLRVKHPERFERQKKEVLKAMKDVRFNVAVHRLRLYANVAGESQVPLADFPFGA